jgi:hypothetical protein
MVQHHEEGRPVRRLEAVCTRLPAQYLAAEGMWEDGKRGEGMAVELWDIAHGLNHRANLFLLTLMNKGLRLPCVPTGCPGGRGARRA